MWNEAAGFVVRSFWAAGIGAAAQSVVQVIAQPQPFATTGHRSWRDYKWAPTTPAPAAIPTQTAPQNIVSQYQPQQRSPVAQSQQTRTPVSRVDYDQYTL